MGPARDSKCPTVGVASRNIMDVNIYIYVHIHAYTYLLCLCVAEILPYSGSQSQWFLDQVPTLMLVSERACWQLKGASGCDSANDGAIFVWEHHVIGVMESCTQTRTLGLQACKERLGAPATSTKRDIPRPLEASRSLCNTGAGASSP